MLELSRDFAVRGADRPTIFAIANRIRTTAVNHRLDRKTHSRMQAFLLRLAIGHVRNVGALVKAQTDSMPDILFDDTETVLSLYIFNDCKTDIGDSATGLDRFDSYVKRIKSTLDDIASFLIDLTNDKGLRLISMPTINDRSQIDINDIARLQLIGAGDSVTDHIVDTRATAFGKRKLLSGIAQTSRDMTVVQRVLMNQTVNFSRSNSRSDMGANKVHQLSIERTRSTHLLPLCFFQPDSWSSPDHIFLCRKRVGGA